jgi:hypothetical protein
MKISIFAFTILLTTLSIHNVSSQSTPVITSTPPVTTTTPTPTQTQTPTQTPVVTAPAPNVITPAPGDAPATVKAERTTTTAVNYSGTYIFLTVDDVVKSVFINGIPIDMSLLPNKSRWHVFDFVRLNNSQLKPGDEVSIVGVGANFRMNNPSNLIAEIGYLDSKGVQKKIYTNTRSWTCDGKRPVNYGLLVESGRGTPIPNAVYIWNNLLDTEEVTCKTVIPLENIATTELDVYTTICTPGEYSIETIHNPRNRATFVCQIKNKAGGIISQDSIGNLLISKIIKFTFLKNDALSPVNYELDYLKQENYVIFTLTFDEKLDNLTQSVKYDIENLGVDLRVNILTNL